MLVPIVAFLAALRAPLVCIDPGHPSEVGVGTRGLKLTELHAVWDVAKRLESTLIDNGYRVVLTKKTEDQFVANKDRSEVANRSNADLFLRLHCDAADGSGFAVYFPDRQGTSQGKTGPSPKLLKRIRPIATRFHAAFAKSLAGELNDNGLKSDLKTLVGSRQGALTGSIFSEVPVLLVELVVLTNRKDEIWLTSQSGRRKIVEALASGVDAALGRPRESPV